MSNLTELPQPSRSRLDAGNCSILQTGGHEPVFVVFIEPASIPYWA